MARKRESEGKSRGKSKCRTKRESSSAQRDTSEGRSRGRAKCRGCSADLAESLLLSGHHHQFCPKCARRVAREGLEALVYHGTLNQEDVSYLLDCLAGEDIKPLFLDPPGRMATGVLVAVSRDYCRALVEEHMAILEKMGRVVFGKFRFQRKKVGGTPLGLEAMGRESFEGKDVGAFADCVRSDLSSGRDVSLFIRDPEPPGRLWRAKIEQIEFNAAGRGDSLPRPRSSFAPPKFPGVQDVKELIPPYYFLNRSRENLGFHCNFWFLVSSWEQVDPASVPFHSRTNSHKIVFSTQVLYPAAVMYDPEGVRRLAADDAAGSNVFPALGSELRRTIETVFSAFGTVRFTSAAIREFAGVPDEFKKQVVKRLLKVEASDASQDVLTVISSPVVSASDLREFKLSGNGGGGRLAAGLFGGELVVVGMDSQHRPPTAFWNEMARRWSDEKTASLRRGSRHPALQRNGA